MMDKPSKEQLHAEMARIQAIWQQWQRGQISLSEDQFLELDNQYWHCLHTLKKRNLPPDFFQKAGAAPTGRARGRPRKNG